MLASGNIFLLFHFLFLSLFYRFHQNPVTFFLFKGFFLKVLDSHIILFYIQFVRLRLLVIVMKIKNFLSKLNLMNNKYFII